MHDKNDRNSKNRKSYWDAHKLNAGLYDFEPHFGPDKPFEVAICNAIKAIARNFIIFFLFFKLRNLSK